MMTGPKLGEEIDDGRKDVIMAINGVKVFVVTQEGLALMNVSYEQGQDAIMGFATMFKHALETVMKTPKQDVVCE